MRKEYSVFVSVFIYEFVFAVGTPFSVREHKTPSTVLRALFDFCPTNRNESFQKIFTAPSAAI